MNHLYHQAIFYSGTKHTRLLCLNSPPSLLTFTETSPSAATHSTVLPRLPASQYAAQVSPSFSHISLHLSPLFFLTTLPHPSPAALPPSPSEMTHYNTSILLKCPNSHTHSSELHNRFFCGPNTVTEAIVLA